MNGLDNIAFAVAKRLLGCKGKQTQVAETCPALLDLVEMTKEMLHGDAATPASSLEAGARGHRHQSKEQIKC